MSPPHYLKRPGQARRFLLSSVLVSFSAFALASLLAAALVPPQAASGPGGTPAAMPSAIAVARISSPTAGAYGAVHPEGALHLESVVQPTTRPTSGKAQPEPTGRAATPVPSVSPERTEQQDDLLTSPSPAVTNTWTPTASPVTLAAATEPSAILPYFGVAMQQLDAAHGLAQAAAAGVGVTRVSELNWDYVEPVRTDPPTYLWDKMIGLEQELVNASQSGIQVTLLVMYTPLWARQVTGRACSPIRDDALDEYAQFLQAAVERYGKPPFNIHDWELYNEPDVDPSLVNAYSGIGCWGDATDPFYGGRAFGRMLMAAYPAIKNADPTAQVIVGGLLLDSPDSPPSTFTAGILEAGAGGSFDLLAFHAYTYYYSPSTPESDRRSDMPWSSRGGVVVGKTQFLRDVMAQYGVAKPLILNEAGIGWYGSKPPPGEFPSAQGDYVTKLYTRGRSLDLKSVIWYGWDAPGWRHMALLNADLSPKPGMSALAVAIEEIGDSEYAGSAGYAGIEGYAFRRSSDRLQVVWPAETQASTIRIPLRDFRRAFDSLGSPVPHAEESGQAVLTIARPVYLVLAP